MAQLFTTLGPKNVDDLGMILPHEHIFVDLRTCDQPGYGEAQAEDVIAMMAPEIEKIKALGGHSIGRMHAGGGGAAGRYGQGCFRSNRFPDNRTHRHLS